MFTPPNWACRRTTSKPAGKSSPADKPATSICRARTKNTSCNWPASASTRRRSRKPAARLKRSFGPLSYIVSAAQIAARQPPRLRIESEHAVTEEGSFVLVGNGRLYGGPFPFFKQAVIDDGLFDVLIFKRLNYLEIIRYMQDVLFSSQITSPEVEYFQTTSLRVTSEGDVPVEIDGELIGNCPVEFSIRAGGLHVFAPPTPPPRPAAKTSR